MKDNEGNSGSLQQPNRINFTKAVLEHLPTPKVGYRYYYDTKVKGLCIGVGKTGRKSFVLYRRIESRPERLPIGPYPGLTVEQARNRALTLIGNIASGNNPAKEKRERDAEMTFAEFFQKYYELHSLPRNRTAAEDLNKYNCHLATAKHGVNLAEMRLSQIRRADIVKLHSTFGRRHPYSANHLLALIRSMFNRAISWGFIEGENPCRGISKFPELARERFVQADELPRLFIALEVEENTKVRDMFYMCLFTGARRGNVMGMRWDQINFDRCVWQIPRTKNGTPQSVPLTGEAIGILKARHTDPVQESPYVFPAASTTGVLVEPKKVWRRVVTRATIVGLVEKIAEKKQWSAGDTANFLRAKLQDYRGAVEELSATAAKNGIESKPLNMRDLRVHDLRRTMGSWQASTGASLPIIGRSLNHKSPQSTAIYARLMLDPVRQAMETATAAMVAVARPEAP